MTGDHSTTVMAPRAPSSLSTPSEEMGEAATPSCVPATSEHTASSQDTTGSAPCCVSPDNTAMMPDPATEADDLAGILGVLSIDPVVIQSVEEQALVSHDGSGADHRGIVEDSPCSGEVAHDHHLQVNSSCSTVLKVAPPEAIVHTNKLSSSDGDYIPPTILRCHSNAADVNRDFVLHHSVSETNGPSDNLEGRGRRTVPAIMAHGRWDDADLRILANIELDFPNTQFIIKQLHSRFTSRSLMSISQQRYKARYKNILAEEQAKRSLPLNNGTNIGQMVAVNEEILTISANEIEADFIEAGLRDCALASNLANGPMRLEDLERMYLGFGVRLRKKGRKTALSEKSKDPSETGTRKSRRQRYREHQRLYKLGPKILLQELYKGTDTGPKVPLRSIHDLFDPLFTSPSPPVEPGADAPVPVSISFTLVEWEEVETARKTTDRHGSRTRRSF